MKLFCRLFTPEGNPAGSKELTPAQRREYTALGYRVFVVRPHNPGVQR